MKNSTMRGIFAAAALVVVAGTASAQTYKADMPVAFQVGSSTLAKGHYQFQVSNPGQALIKVTNLETNRSILVVPQGTADAPKAWRHSTPPMISLECAGTTCAMSRLSGGEGELTYTIPVRKLPQIEARRTDIVTVALSRMP